MAAQIPDSHLDLLRSPRFAHLATIRPDGTPHVNPVWFSWDGELLSFTTSTLRYKYRNIAANPNVALSINDPDQPYRYLEVRGLAESIEPDPEAKFFFQLADRYGLEIDHLDDTPHRVKISVRPTRASWQ